MYQNNILTWWWYLYSVIISLFCSQLQIDYQPTVELTYIYYVSICELSENQKVKTPYIFVQFHQFNISIKQLNQFNHWKWSDTKALKSKLNNRSTEGNAGPLWNVAVALWTAAQLNGPVKIFHFHWKRSIEGYVFPFVCVFKLKLDRIFNFSQKKENKKV